jgi:uncharacterized membrane protein YccC
VRALFAPETHPLDRRLAVRGTLGLMAPLLLGQALGWNALNPVALAAFLLAFGDLAEDRGWLARLTAGSAFGALAVATGALVGAHPAIAAGGMLLWGIGAGLAGVYGAGAAAMALPVTWVFLELGLTSPGHSPADALRLGALFAAGGAWAVVLAWATRAISPVQPLVEQTALCFTALADYLEHALGDPTTPAARPMSVADGYRPSRETRVRSAIGEARALAVEMRGRQAAASPSEQRLVILVELADQIFNVAALLPEIRSREGAPASSSQEGVGDRPSQVDGRALVAGARAVARALGHSPDSPALARVQMELARLGAAAPSAPPNSATGSAPAGRAGDAALSAERAQAEALIAGALAHAVEAAAGQNSPSPTVPETGSASERLPRPLTRPLAPLRRCLDRRSVVGRHALRFGVVTAVAVAIEEALASPFGYWIPLTVTVVLKPYAGSTLTRAGQRLAGTIAGAVVGVAVTHLLGAPLARAAVAGAAFYATLAVLPLNYAFAIFFLSAGVVPFESFMGPSTSWPVGMLRVLHTCLGGALALAGGYVLWPSFERRS